MFHISPEQIFPTQLIPVSRVKGINRMQGESMFAEVIIANYEVSDE